MEDITILVRKQNCSHLSFKTIQFTFVRPAILATEWFADASNLEVKWFRKNISELPKQSDKYQTTCHRFLSYVIPKYFKIPESTLRDRDSLYWRKHLYKKLLFYNDGSDRITILYILNKIEYDEIVNTVAPKSTAVFTTNPRPNEVVRKYTTTIKKWPKLLAMLLTAGAVTATGMKIAQRLRASPLVIEPPNIDTFVPEGTRKIQYFRNCPGVYYVFREASIALWKKKEYKKALESITNESSVGRATLVRDILSALIQILQLNKIALGILDLYSSLFIDSFDKIKDFLRSGGTNFDFSIIHIPVNYSFLFGQIQGRIITDKEHGILKCQHERFQSIKQIIGDVLCSKSFDIGVLLTHVSVFADTSMFFKTELGKDYLKVLMRYANQFLVTVILEHFSMAKFNNKLSNNVRVLSNLLPDLCSYLLKSGTFIDIASKIYRMFSMLSNRILLVESNIPKNCTSDSLYYHYYYTALLFDPLPKTPKVRTRIDNNNAQSYLILFHLFAFLDNITLPNNLQHLASQYTALVHETKDYIEAHNVAGLSLFSLLRAIYDVRGVNSQILSFINSISTIASSNTAEVRDNLVRLQAVFDSMGLSTFEGFCNRVMENEGFFNSEILNEQVPEIKEHGQNNKFYIHSDSRLYYCYLAARESDGVITVDLPGSIDNNIHDRYLWTLREHPRDKNQKIICNAAFPDRVLVYPESRSLDHKVILVEIEAADINRCIIPATIPYSDGKEATVVSAFPCSNFQLCDNNFSRYVGFLGGWVYTCSTNGNSQLVYFDGDYRSIKSRYVYWQFATETSKEP